MCQRLDLFREMLDTLIETSPVAAEVLDHSDHARKVSAKEVKPLTDWNAALQQEATDLIDHNRSLGRGLTTSSESGSLLHRMSLRLALN
jgi:hypothetical protein